jgi:hypothetical protein
MIAALLGLGCTAAEGAAPPGRAALGDAPPQQAPRLAATDADACVIASVGADAGITLTRGQARLLGASTSPPLTPAVAARLLVAMATVHAHTQPGTPLPNLGQLRRDYRTWLEAAGTALPAVPLTPGACWEGSPAAAPQAG